MIYRKISKLLDSIENKKDNKYSPLEKVEPKSKLY
jgi:hypothetical protein